MRCRYLLFEVLLALEDGGHLDLRKLGYHGLIAGMQDKEMGLEGLAEKSEVEVFGC